MRAILLAAGRGRRLGVDEPKCLIEICGRSLLERHLDNMVAAGIDELTVVMGHGREALSAALDRAMTTGSNVAAAPPLTIERVFNELYHHGSIVSLQRASAQLAAGAIWMDADVLYPAALLRRLVESPQANCALLDARASETGEEMMLAARDGRLMRIGRRVGSDWDVVGESVGFFKVDAAGGAVMAEVLDGEIGGGRLDQEHEDALERALARVGFGFELVGEVPWTEIDFPEDLAKAERMAPEIDGARSQP